MKLALALLPLAMASPVTMQNEPTQLEAAFLSMSEYKDYDGRKLFKNNSKLFQKCFESFSTFKSF